MSGENTVRVFNKISKHAPGDITMKKFHENRWATAILLYYQSIAVDHPGCLRGEEYGVASS